MAWEKINEYTNSIETIYLKLNDRLDHEPDLINRSRLKGQLEILFQLLLMYHESVLLSAKFKMQRAHCRSILEKLNPAFCQGYFKTKKK